MDIKKLQRTIVDALEDVKAQDIVVFNTTGLTTLFDRVLIATASSNRQTRALASRVGEKVKAAGGHVISTEGLDTGEWVLVDLGDAVVHIMQPAIRAYYKLEEIWGGKPVRMVLGGGRPARPEAEPEPEEVAAEEPAPAARKPAARKPAAKTPARSGAKPAARSAAKPAARSAKSAKSARPAKSAGSAPRRAAGKTAKPAAKPRARKTAAKRAG
ncbi:MAG TPA: ribosome silencing factor [Burkholderiaceae bacterium]|nr:ribosome silencing factor [Burkholderiaceae bacterium]